MQANGMKNTAKCGKKWVKNYSLLKLNNIEKNMDINEWIGQRVKMIAEGF